MFVVGFLRPLVGPFVLLVGPASLVGPKSIFSLIANYTERCWIKVGRSYHSSVSLHFIFSPL